MVYNFLRNGAGINVLARHAGARVVVADLGVASKLDSAQGTSASFKDRKIAFGTKNFTTGPAMTRDEAVSSIETGIGLLEDELSDGVDIVGTGDMGIGNTTPSAAITAAITGKPAKDVTGRGTGIDDAGLRKKIEVITKGLALNKPDPHDGIDVLSKVGGFEIGGLAGIIIGAAAHRIPVVIDGFISGAAALIAFALEPGTGEYMIASHCSAERGHRIILDHL
jgi:nicotinate-nucleotide--dimethylbenzimidazole phosphoribosyltransferase